MLLLDVRSPSEFQKGHVPGAVSLPLFDDEERHDVGLCYAEQGQEAAIRLGLERIGPKMAAMVAEVDRLAHGEKALEVYCWRGGMRSGSVAWLLGVAGYRVRRWEGGYKVYRRGVLQSLAEPRPYRVLTGRTGVGKTEALKSLAKSGIQVIDLEGLANHRGSTFGHVGLGNQPTSEHFENLLAAALGALDSQKPIWVEDESQSIGKVWLQPSFFLHLRAAPRLEVVRSAEERAVHLAEIYGQAPHEQLKDGFTKLTRKLGGQWIPVAHEAIDQGRLDQAALLALRYYDQTYDHSMSKTASTVAQVLDWTGQTEETSSKALVQAALSPTFAG
jgi:tRNA 2-selenouridine synthase